MITRAITGDNDWTFGNGRQNYLTEQDAISQNIKTRLQSFVNDCFFDLAAGVDWFTFLGSKNQTALKNAIIKQILTTTGVQTVNQVDINLDEKRNLGIKYSVTTIWGDTITNAATI